MSVMEVMNLDALARSVADARMRAQTARDALAEVKAEEEQAEQRLLDAMEAQGVKSAKVPGVGLLTATVKTSARYNVEDLHKAMEWVKGLGHGDAIRPSVLPSQFTAMVKDAMEAGQTVPEFIKIHQEQTLSFRKEN